MNNYVQNLQSDCRAIAIIIITSLHSCIITNPWKILMNNYVFMSNAWNSDEGWKMKDKENNCLHNLENHAEIPGYIITYFCKTDDTLK